MKQGQASEGTGFLAAMITNAPDAQLESGLPVAPLAELKLLELAQAHTNWAFAKERAEAICSNAVAHPTLLTPRLLAATAKLQDHVGFKNTAAKWERIWQLHQQTRAVYREARKKWLADIDETGLFQEIDAARRNMLNSYHQHHTNQVFRLDPPPFTPDRDSENSNAVPVIIGTGILRAVIPIGTWVDLDERWLVLASTTQGLWRGWLCRRETAVREIVHEIFQTQRIPAYFEVSVSLAGRSIPLAGRAEASMAFRPGTNIWARATFPLRPAAAPLDYPFKNLVDPILLRRYAVDPRVHSSAGYGIPARGGFVADNLQVAVRLGDPGALFARQRQRTVWFGLLIGAAVIAAVIGYAAAWRAFRRQQRLGEMKTNFVSSVSHELRAPIASVRLMAEGLERGKVQAPEKQREYFQFIVQECRRLSSLIENVLDFSRIEQGRKQCEFEPTDLVALVGQTLKLMEPCAAERQVQLAVTVPAEPVSADVDGKAIQQALVNLIDNAIKHSPTGQTVTVGLEIPPRHGLNSAAANSAFRTPHSAFDPSLNSPPSTLNLFVSDHGEGIPAAEHEKIFERFYRRGSELRRTTPGVGIGLSLVKHIVEAHGGRVRVRSAVGQGSRFTIELPLTQTSVQSPKSKAV
ncbi:MAG: sensor histidine kinase [Limisphaerales bacterium]